MLTNSATAKWERQPSFGVKTSFSGRVVTPIGHGTPIFCVAGPCLSRNLTVPGEDLRSRMRVNSNVAAVRESLPD